MKTTIDKNNIAGVVRLDCVFGIAGSLVTALMPKPDTSS